MFNICKKHRINFFSGNEKNVLKNIQNDGIFRGFYLKEKVINDTNTILALKSDVINKINTTQAVLTANQACQEKLNTSFTQYTNQTPQKTTMLHDALRDVLRAVCAA